MTAFSVPINLAFETRGELVATINEWLDRNDLTGSALGMIALCESRLRRELSGLKFETSEGVSVVDGVGAIPASCDFIRSVFSGQAPLDEMSPEIGRQVGAGDTAIGYSLEAGQIRVWPAWTGTLTVLFQSRLPFLADDADTNAVLQQHPDVYFFGSMMFAEGYLANDSRLVLFKQLWDEAIMGLQRYYRRQRRDRPRLRNPGVIV